MTTKALDKAIAVRQEELTALIRTREILNHTAKNGKVTRHADVLAGALHLDAARRANGHAKLGRPPGKDKTVRVHTVAGIEARRKRTAKFLARIEASGTTPYVANALDSRKIAVLVLHKYIKKQGAGYVRTDKAFAP